MLCQSSIDGRAIGQISLDKSNVRRHGLASPYEQLKELTRGKAVTREGFHAFIDGLDLPPAERERLKAMTPAGYTGLAATLARRA